MKPNKPLIAILMQREHNRLISQVNSLVKLLSQPYSDMQYNRLLEIARKWQHLLTYEQGKERVLNALEKFTEAYKNQGESLQEDYYELMFQAGLYRKGQWGYIRECLGTFKDCMNDFGAVLPEYKKDFKRKYEPHGTLSVEQQSRMLKEQIELIPNRKDPWRTTEMMELGLIDENGFAPMGKKQAFELLEFRDQLKKSKTGKVIDFFANKLKTKGR
jgi:hypothetical protein